MTSTENVRIHPTNEGTDGSCRECGSWWYSNIIDGYCPDCLLMFAAEDGEY